MLHFNVGWLFGKPSTRKNIRQIPTKKRLTRRLLFEDLEGRALLTQFLGAAETFAVLGGQAVTNTGPSAIVGDVGVSPGASVTGFPPGLVTLGSIHAADALAAQAQSDLTTVYNVVAGLPVTADLTGQDLGGLMLTAGVYHFSSSAQLTGTLTLDAQGNPNAEFDFQIGSTLTTASNSSVVVINGGDPCDVFWQIGSSATLGTTTVFVGHILALTSITLLNGASIDGSALARNGAVTLDDNVISIADCLTGSISGVKFNDINGDGVRQVGDTPLAGLTLFLDTNNNGVLDTGEMSTVSDVNGNYSFVNLAAGTYRVRESPQAGLLLTTPNPAPITLVAGQVVAGVDFGDFRLISISGTKFQDMNGNGVRNIGDPALPGITVFLDANNNGVLDVGETRTVTDVNGNFSFLNLGPGTYRVRESLPAGVAQTTTNPANIVASSGTNVSAIAFGDFLLVSISGNKFQDTNGNGTRDPGEPGLQGFVIFLDANNNGVLDAGERNTTTDASGNYTIANLAIGTYRVREVQQVGYVQMTLNPANIVVTTSGANVAGISFGNMPTSSLVAVSKLLFIGRNLANLLDGTFAQQAIFVANLFPTFLGRAPDVAGLTYYLRLLQAGYTQAQVTAIFRANFHV